MTKELRLASSGILPTGSSPARTYVEAVGKNEVAYRKSGPLNMYSIVSCLVVRYFSENARILERSFSSRAKMESKLRACEIHAASLVRAASGEFGEGGSPAKNRAVSSAVAVSAQLARAAANTTVKVIRMVAITRVAAADTFAQRAPIHSIGLLAACLGRIVEA